METVLKNSFLEIGVPKQWTKLHMKSTYEEVPLLVLLKSESL